MRIRRNLSIDYLLPSSTVGYLSDGWVFFVTFYQ